jgi:hypothetical protein
VYKIFLIKYITISHIIEESIAVQIAACPKTVGCEPKESPAPWSDAGLKWIRMDTGHLS